MRTLHAVTTSLLLALSACGFAGDEPIYIGVAGPVGQDNGRSMRLAAEMAVEEINRAGGVDGRELRLVIKDDEARPERAIEVAEELRSDPRIVAVVGHVNSPATLAAAEIYNDEENGVVQISPASSSPLVSDAGDWTFRVCPSDLQHGPALAAWAYGELDARRAEVLYVNDAYGRGVMQSFSNALEEAGGTVISRDPYSPDLLNADNGVAPYLERALRSGADVLMIAGQAREAETILATARRLGYRGPVLGADGLTGLTGAGASAEGVYVSSAFLPDRPTPEARAFVRAYRDRYDELPDHRGAMTYDAIRLIARAIDEAGTDRRAVRDYIAGVGSDAPAFDGVSGTIAFDPNGDVVNKEITVGVIQDGKLVTAGL